MAADSTLRTLLAYVVLLAAAPLVAEETRETEPGEEQAKQRLFFDAVDVDVINVEVVVTDKQGHPVTGLTRDDFEIFEDGEKMELTNFHEVRGVARESPEDEPSTPGDAPAPDAAAGDRGDQRLVILVDNMNISPQSRKLLFTKLREHLRERMAPAGQCSACRTRQAMLATLDRKVEIVLPFTDDRELLLSALEEVEQQGSSHALLDGDRRMFVTRLQRARLPGYNPPQAVVRGNVVEGDNDPDFNDAVRIALDLAHTVRTLGEQRYRKVKTTIDTLDRFCQALGGMPERKALVYLSDGIPLRPADALTEAWSGKYQSWVLQSSNDIRSHSVYPNADQTFQRVINSLASSEFDLSHDLHQLNVNASSQRVAFYPISTYGRSPEYLSASVSGGSINAGSGSMLRRAQELESFTRDASLLQMAEETGGQALIRSANFGELLDRVDRDFTSYYALGYTLPPPEEEETIEPAENDPATTAKGKAARAGKRKAAKVAKAEATREKAAQAKEGRYGKFRKTRVKVKREGVLVRHGKGYNPKSWRQRLGAMTLASALFEVESNPLGVELEPGDATREGDRFRLKVLLTVPFDQIRLVYHEEQYIAQLTAVVVIRNEGDGGLSEPQRIDFPIKISGRRILEAVQQLAGYVLELEIGEGPKRIAVGLRDHFARTEATVHLGITVGEGTS